MNRIISRAVEIFLAYVFKMRVYCVREVRVALEQAIKAQRGRRGVVLLFL
jgi:hypothetical protein